MSQFNDFFSMSLDFVSGQEDYSIDNEGKLVQTAENHADGHCITYLHDNVKDVTLQTIRAESKEHALQVMKEWLSIWDEYEDYGTFIEHF